MGLNGVDPTGLTLALAGISAQYQAIVGDNLYLELMKKALELSEGKLPVEFTNRMHDGKSYTFFKAKQEDFRQIQLWLQAASNFINKPGGWTPSEIASLASYIVSDEILNFDGSRLHGVFSELSELLVSSDQIIEANRLVGRGEEAEMQREQGAVNSRDTATSFVQEAAITLTLTAIALRHGDEAIEAFLNKWFKLAAGKGKKIATAAKQAVAHSDDCGHNAKEFVRLLGEGKVCYSDSMEGPEMWLSFIVRPRSSSHAIAYLEDSQMVADLAPVYWKNFFAENPSIVQKIKNSHPECAAEWIDRLENGALWTLGEYNEMMTALNQASR